MATTYIICAAGVGSRLKSVATDIPKPLLLLEGRTFLEHSVLCLPIGANDRIVIVGQERDGLERVDNRLAKSLRGVSVKWMNLAAATRGQLETAVIALALVPEDHSVAIFNADSVFSSAELASLIEAADDDGLIPCTVASGNYWSFCETEESSDRVVRVAEKERISEHCSVGFYWFKSRSDFLRLAREEILKCFAENSAEPYVAPLYNRFISERKTVSVVPTQMFKAMGTPEQLKIFWGLDVEDLHSQNAMSPYREGFK